jgi:lysophospholipase L1-like esterase
MRLSTRVVLGISAVLAVAMAIVGVAVIAPTDSGRAVPKSLNSAGATGATGVTGPLVAFYGDSFTRGSLASSPDKRWSTIVSRDHGWREFNPSHNGLGFIRHRSLFGPGDLPDLIIAQRPDIVIITLGLNDNFAFADSADAIHTQIGADFTRLKLALPDARFIVVEPFWNREARPPSVDIISGWVKAAAADIHADYIPGASHWIEHHPEWMASDGLHPNDRGYAVIALRMDAQLAQRGL